ncbi:MAG: ABC transporter substrate-binding protein [Mycetocola sp.]
MKKHSSLFAMRPRSRRWLPAAAITVAAVTVLAGCSGGGGTAAPTNEIATGEYPEYYPDDYQDLVDAAEKEGGTLEMYSNPDQENWAPIFRDFQKKYPFVKTINANNLDSDEVFQRVLSEQATGGTDADILVSNAAQAWANYMEDDEMITAYESPETDELPEFAQPLPGVYAMSMDPAGITYNTSLLPEGPTGFEDLASKIEADPDSFAKKITTRDVTGSFGFTVSHAYMEARPEAWEWMETILPNALPETSSGTQGEKILAGEYVTGFFISSAPSYPIVESSGGLYEVVFPEDGTVVLPRAIAVAPEAPHTNTAKLFLDFVLSEEGQNAVAEGGLTSYRDSVKAAEGLHTYQEVVDTVGEDEIIFVDYHLVPQADVDAFISQWDGLLG